MDLYDLRGLYLDTYWRDSENSIYLDDMKEPLPDAPLKVKNSYEHYKCQIEYLKRNIHNSLYRR